MHLTDWPEAEVLPADAELVAAMDQVREVCSVASSLRKAKKLRVRLPLPKLTVAVENPQRLEPFTDLIADELNVKKVELTDAIDTYGRFELTVNARVAGPRLGKDVQAAIKAVKAGEGVVNADGTLTAGPARAATRRVQLPAGGRRPGIHRRAAGRGRTGGAGRHGDARSSRPRAGPRTASANCRSCASRPGWTSPTGSAW